MRKSMKKVLSGVSAAALVFGAMSAYVAFAEAGDTEAATEVSTAADLKSAVAAGKSIKLTGDITLTETLVVPEDVTATIDLDGHTLNEPNDTAITVNGTLTIQDTGTDGKIVGNNQANQNYNIKVSGSGTLNWESGTFEDAGVGASNRLTSIDVGTNRTGGTLNITGGTFKTTGANKVKNLIQVPGGSLNIENATIEADTRAFVVGCDTTISDAVVNGGIYVVGGTEDGKPAIDIEDTDITGDIITGVGNRGGNAAVTVSGGSFNGALDYGTVEDTSGIVEFKNGVSGNITEIKNAGNADAGQLKLAGQLPLKVAVGSVDNAKDLLPTDSAVEVGEDERLWQYSLM